MAQQYIMINPNSSILDNEQDSSSFLDVNTSQMLRKSPIRAMAASSVEDQKYQSTFSQLSLARSDLRALKQENNWLTMTKSGLQQQNSTLKDILKQKKQVITKMQEQIHEKTLQLGWLEAELREAREHQHQMLTSIGQYKEQIKSLGEKLQKAEQRAEAYLQEKQQQQKQIESRIAAEEARGLESQKSARLQEQVQLTLNRIHSNISAHSAQSLMSPSSMSSTGSLFINGIKTAHGGLEMMIQTLNNQINNTMIPALNNATHSLEETRMKLGEAQRKLKETEACVREKDITIEKLNIQVKEEIEKNGQLLSQLKRLAVEENKAVMSSTTRLQQLTERNEELSDQIDALKVQLQTYQKKCFSEYIPILRPFLPEELLPLLRDLADAQDIQNSDKLRDSVRNNLLKEIEKLAGLELCQKQHYKAVEQSSHFLKSQVTRLTGERELLKIKLQNLQRAYQHAVDDYRRSVRCGALSTVSREGRRWNNQFDSDKENNMFSGNSYK